jgi:NAD(P)-dependent dehydrogenase (short-subunit alcohol dehydrogenase family)
MSVSVNAGEFQGRRALVTGGTQGLGAGIAERLLDGGAQVVVSGRSRNPQMPAGAILVMGDLATRHGTQHVAQQAIEILGGLDILVNNAGGAEIYLGGHIHPRRGLGEQLRSQLAGRSSSDEPVDPRTPAVFGGSNPEHVERIGYDDVPVCGTLWSGEGGPRLLHTYPRG